MPLRLVDRLSAARHTQFVGRDGELALFRSVVNPPELPFSVLFVFGPGGVGKTSLLGEFVRLCDLAQVSALYMDGRNVEPSPESFTRALGTALGLAQPDRPLESLASQNQRCVILIDTYEVLAPLDAWLRQVFLPQLTENVLVVLAGRYPPGLAWSADPGWQTLLHVLPLRNLSPGESRTYLTRRQVPAEQHPAILGFTHGHPLALSLVADVFAQRPDVRFQPEAEPDVIKKLLEQLVQKVPGPAHRTALEACAMVRVTTEALLAEMLGMPDAHELFEWLRELSFIQVRRGGLFPHDLVREALAADLRWRNPDWYAELHRRARIYYTTRLGQTAGQAQQRALWDLIFLHRDNPVVRPFFEWQSSGSLLADTLHDADLPALMAMVTMSEGEESACLAEHWLARQRDGVSVYRDSEGQPAGFLAMVALEQASAEDRSVDPAAHLAWSYLQRHAPLRPGERATFFRFWMANDTYQTVSAVQSLIFLNMVRHYLTTPGLAFTFIPCAQPEFWAPVFAYAELARIPQADFEVGGRRYGVYGHDWRVMPPVAWLALLAEREIAAEPQATQPPHVTEPLLVLSQPDFAEALREALRHFGQPDLLRQNPLLRSRLVIERAGAHVGADERVAVLQALIKEAAESLQLGTRQIKSYRALYHTYFQPASTQEQVAELLDLPFSTYRRHLQTGIARMSEILWQQEVGGSPRGSP
jgi:hypothetical protein